MAEATPDFSRGTAFMTDVVDGAITQPIEKAMPQNHRPSGQYGMSAVHASVEASSADWIARPATTSFLPPTFAPSLTLEPAPIIRPSAIGSIAAPASSAE